MSHGTNTVELFLIAMLIIFAFNILFWMFFEQAGSSFTFLADQIVNRDLGGWTFPTAWFQSVIQCCFGFLERASTSFRAATASASATFRASVMPPDAVMGRPQSRARSSRP